MPIQTPRPGSLGITTRKDAVSWLIRLGQFINRDKNAEFSHVFVVIDDHTVAEAQIKGFVLSPRAKYDNTNTIYFDPNISEDRRKAIITEAYRLVGTPYSIWSYFLMLTARLGFRPGWLKRRVESNKELICSASADLIYNRAGINLFDDGRIPGEVTPADIVECMLKRQWQPGFYNKDIHG